MFYCCVSPVEAESEPLTACCKRHVFRLCGLALLAGSITAAHAAASHPSHHLASHHLASPHLASHHLAGCADGKCIRTHVVERAQMITGFGQILPTAVLTLRASLTGEIQNTKLALGQKVFAHQIVGYLGGPIIDGQIKQAIIESAQQAARVKAAARAVEIERHTLKDQLSTQTTLLRAEQALDAAKADWARAKAAQKRLQQARVLRAPAAGVVTSIAQTNGSLVQPGKAIAQIEPTEDLRLRARFYPLPAAQQFGSIHPKMPGWFTPVGSTQKIAVEVDSVLPLDAQDGAVPVMLQLAKTPAAPTDAGTWGSNVAGTVELIGDAHKVTPIPTRALVLEHGQWWVLVRKAGQKEDHWQRQAVAIGESHGEMTDVTAGLSADEQVLVDQAYLEFHRHFGLRYQQPD